MPRECMGKLSNIYDADQDEYLRKLGGSTFNGRRLAQDRGGRVGLIMSDCIKMKLQEIAIGKMRRRNSRAPSQRARGASSEDPYSL